MWIEALTYFGYALWGAGTFAAAIGGVSACMMVLYDEEDPRLLWIGVPLILLAGFSTCVFAASQT